MDSTRGLCASFHARTCSRPPLPTSNKRNVLPDMTSLGLQLHDKIGQSFITFEIDLRSKTSAQSRGSRRGHSCTATHPTSLRHILDDMRRPAQQPSGTVGESFHVDEAVGGPIHFMSLTKYMPSQRSTIGPAECPLRQLFTRYRIGLHPSFAQATASALDICKV